MTVPSDPSAPVPDSRKHSFQSLVHLMARLRAPDGCPWDRKQSHASLKPYLLEETYEVLETIDEEDFSKLQEELGDVLLQVLFHAQIRQEAGSFTIDDVIQQLAEKLIRRHPHVFENSSGNTDKSEPMDPDRVYAKWEEIKREERKQDGRSPSALDGVPKTLPALLKAYQIQARASRVGFDWPHNQQGLDEVFKKIQEEIVELREVLEKSRAGMPSSSPKTPSTLSVRRTEEEFGDVLFSLVNLSRFIKVNPEDALRRATDRFSRRFTHMEREAAKRQQSLDHLTLDDMNQLWESAKADSPGTIDTTDPPS